MNTHIKVTPELIEKIAHFYGESVPDMVGDPLSVSGLDFMVVHPGQVGQSHTGIYLDEDYEHLRSFTDRGWRTVWFNLAGEISPDFVPVHDGDVRSLDTLSQIPALVKKPSLAQCRRWLDEWDVPEHVREHSRLVAWSAYALGVMLQNRGLALDPVLAHRGGLLHDLDKIETLEGEIDHGEAAADFLVGQGCHHLADTVRGHVLHMALRSEADDRSWETKLVFFCDKLVEGVALVPFDERLQALKVRYPRFRPVMERAEPYVWGLSDQICSLLSIPGHRILIDMLRKLQNN